MRTDNTPLYTATLKENAKAGSMGFLKNIFGIKCPYCGGDLEMKPGRKKKYPHCENYIYV